MIMGTNIKNIIQKLLLGLAAVITVACNSDDLDEGSYYTFTGETVASYCEDRPSTFSIFSQILKDTGLEALLSSYGHYTCFIPTDEAFESYFRENGFTYESLAKEQKETIVYNHIIRSVTVDYQTKDFTDGALASTNMNNTYMVISYIANEDGTNSIMVNKSSKIIVADIEVHNGIIHAIDKVIVPSDETLGSVLENLNDFKLFSEAFNLTHMNDSISETYDMSYANPYTTEFISVLGYTMKTLHQKRLGYTLLAEPDEVFVNAGIHNLADLVVLARQYYGSEDLDDYTSRRNPLNRFISYHLLNRQMSTNSFVYPGGCTAPAYMNERNEYYETMLENRLIEFKANYRINTLSDGTSVTVNVAKSNISGANGYIHCLNDILVYDQEKMESDVLNKRMRFDAYGIPPELTNNNIRWQLTGLDGYGYTIPAGYCGDSFKFNDATKFIMWASEDWTNYQADEMSIRGWYDVSVRIPPVPPGTYEIRLGYSVRDWGGLAQIFIDGKIVGIPVDFHTKPTDPNIGWVADDKTQDGGIENDKMLRNRGYMKGPESAYKPNYNETLRQSEGALRKIIGRFTFQEYGPHYFRAKNIESELGEFHFDYIEMVPVSYIDNEGKD